MSKIKNKKEELVSTGSAFKKVLLYIGEYKKDTFFAWIYVILESICEALVAFMMQYLVTAINQKDVNGIYLYCGVIAALVIVACFTGIMSGYWAASASSGLGKNLRRSMYEKVQKYSFKNIDKFSTASIVTRLTTDVTNVQNAFQMAIRAVVRAPLLLIISLIMCFITEWKVAWVFAVIVPLILFLLLFIAKFVHPTFVEVFNKYDELNESVQEDVDGIRVVKAFNREDLQTKKFNGVSEFIYKKFTFAERILAFNNPIMNVAVYGALILLAYFGSVLIVNSGGTEMGTAQLTSLFTYVFMIFNSLMMLSMVYTMITIARNSVERINEVIEEVPDIQSPENALTEVSSGDIEFKNVNFAYVKDKNVLHDINLHIPSGSTLGIIGSTGSSKTTLISLIARLYDVKNGEVDVAGHNVKEYSLVSLRDAVAVVLQKNLLFTGTIRDNLKWGNKDATDEEIWKACDLAQATSFLKSFPKGLDTMLDEGGTNVSGGQKQRLCIARALLKNPRILILDDSTSACDTHTDALIRKGLASTRKDVTKIIIAQRVLSIKDCDNIIVLDQGKIIGQGNNDQLMENCEIYKSLYESQLGGGGDFDERS